MEQIYWYQQCSKCDGQGRLFIFEDLTNKRLYLHCEECEWGWLHPDLSNDPANGFLTLLVEFEAVEASYEKIVQYGWEKYAAHSEVINS